MLILIADDHAAVREGVRALLQSHDESAVCCEASNGVDAVQVALDEHPDVAIIDLAMPRMNGIEAARRIMEKNPDIPVVILSMHEEFSAQLDALKQMGIKGFVPKSQSGRQLIQAIEAVTRGGTYFRTREFDRWSD